MQRIEFNAEEVEVLREVLQHTLTEIDVEILHTDSHDFKERLKRRRENLERIMAKLSSAPVAA